MRNRIAISFAISIVTLACTSCVKQTSVAARTPQASKPATPPPSLSEYIRTAIKISSENTEANAAALEQLHLEKPEIADLAASVAANPNDIESMRLLAAAYLEHGLYVNAFQFYQQLRLNLPADAAADIGLARIWDEWRDYGLAIDHANRAVSLDPQAALALDLKGRIHLHRSETDAALASFLAAVRLAPDNAPLLANTGYVYLLKGDFEKARPYLERAVEIDGSIAQARNNLGIVLAHFGEREGALQHFMAANEPAAAHNNLGVALLAERQWKEAQQQFQQALAINPAYALAAQNLKEAQSHLPPPTIYTIQPFATVLHEAGAIAADTAPASLDPRSPMSLSEYMRKIFRMQGDAARAEQVAQFEVKPGLVDLIRRINLPAGEDVFKNYRQITASPAELAPAGRPAPTGNIRAAPTGIIEAADTGSPADAWELARTGQAYLERGQWQKARASLQRALEIDGSIREARNNLGVVLARTGDRQGALQQFMTISAPALAHHHLGLVYMSEKKYNQARAEFQRARAINPELAEVRAELAQVETHFPPPVVYAIQVFSARKQDAAIAQADTFSRQAGVATTIEKADLDGKGVWYRARIHGFDSLTAALKAAKNLIVAGLIREYWIAPVTE